MRIPPPMRCFSSPSRFTDPLGWGSFQRVPQSSCTLPAHADLRSIGLVALILYGLLRRRPQRLFVRILRQIARASDHLFTVYNANQPLGLASVPGNFHLIRTHSHLPLRVLCASSYTASPFRKRPPAHFLLGCLAVGPWFGRCSILHRRAWVGALSFISNVKVAIGPRWPSLDCLRRGHCGHPFHRRPKALPSRVRRPPFFFTVSAKSPRHQQFQFGTRHTMMATLSLSLFFKDLRIVFFVLQPFV